MSEWYNEAASFAMMTLFSAVRIEEPMCRFSIIFDENDWPVPRCSWGSEEPAPATRAKPWPGLIRVDLL